MIENILKLLIFVSFLVISCCHLSDGETAFSDNDVIIDNQQFKSAVMDQLTINDMTIDNDCLKINFSASGCSGDSWIIKLIDSNSVYESEPPKRKLKLSLQNDELCDAYITKEVAFDISELRVSGSKVLLVINDNTEIMYHY